MAFTITSLGVNATAVGTSGADIITASDVAGLESLKLNAFQGSDIVEIANVSLQNGSFGLGGDIDVFSYTDSATDRVNFTATMGDGADEIELSLFDIDGVTVGGQGGADTFDLSLSGEGIKLGGGQGMDTFTGTFIGANGGGVSIVGGSEDDTFDLSFVDAFNDGASKGTLWMNGQVGEDSFEIDELEAFSGSNVTVRGGSEDDTFNITVGFVSISTGAALGIFGDNGNDTFDVNGLLTGDDGIIQSAFTVFGGAGDDTMNVESGYATVSGGAGNDTYEVEDFTGSTITGVTEESFVDLFAVDNIIVFEDDFAPAGAEVKTFVGFDAGDSFVMDDDWDVALDGTGAVAFADNVTYFATGNILGDNSFSVGTGAAATDAIVYIGGRAGSSSADSAINNDTFILISDATGLTVDSFEFDLVV